MTTPVFVRNLIVNTFEAKFGDLPSDAIAIVAVKEDSQGFNWRCQFNDNWTDGNPSADHRHAQFICEQVAAVRSQFPLVIWSEAA